MACNRDQVKAKLENDLKVFFDENLETKKNGHTLDSLKLVRLDTITAQDNIFAMINKRYDSQDSALNVHKELPGTLENKSSHDALVKKGVTIYFSKCKRNSEFRY